MEVFFKGLFLSLSALVRAERLMLPLVGICNPNPKKKRFKVLTRIVFRLPNLSASRQIRMSTSLL